jgi:hypothetical protein
MLRRSPSQSRLHRFASQLTQSIRSNPSGGPRAAKPNPLCRANSRAIEAQISLTDLAQRPIHGLPDKISLVIRLSFDDLQ